MSVEVWRFNRTGFSHENQALLYLARELDALSEHFLIIAHPILSGQELDALVFKRDMVFVVEFKKVGGPVTGDLYGPWTSTQADGTTFTLNEGRNDNPFQQIQNCYRAALTFLNSHQDTFLTPSEAAMNDFRKIKNVLILDPEYDVTLSAIELGKEAWKLNIVGLHNDVAGLFVTLNHTQLHLTEEQMRIIARDVLHCTQDADIMHLLQRPLGGGAVEALKSGWQTVRAQIAKGSAAWQRQVEQWYTTHPVDFEELLDALRRAADRSVRHLPPDKLVANDYTVILHPAAYENLEQLQEHYEARLGTHLLDYLNQEGYKPAHKPIVVRVEPQPESDKGIKPIEVRTAYQAAPAVACLEGPRGKNRSLYPGDIVKIGRGEHVDYQVCDERARPVISREHCYIKVSEDGSDIVIYDNNSVNGLFVNGAEVPTASLADGDSLLLGRNKRDEEGPILRVRLLT